MSRSVPWRRTVSDACNWHQSQALDSTIYILRQTGPTGFLLKEEGERKNVKVFMGDPHTCTCPVFKKERDLCKHICWLLLKKFRLSRNDPLSWQLGLVEREINEILRGRVTAERPERQVQAKRSATNQVVNGRPVVEQRDIAEEDVCPICQEELLAKKLPVTYCKFACGNTIHIKCMQVWAEHQQKSTPEGTIKCPMCREDFGPIDLLKTEMRNSGCRPDPPAGIRQDRHIGVMCSNCSKAPIEGKCYRCTVCPTFHLCQRCFNFPIHTTHPFQFRQKRNQRWRSAPRTLGSGLPDALVNDLMRRDITENDYDLLLQMERNEREELSNLTEDDLRAIPVERIRESSALLSLGAQCRICLRGFTVGQTVRRLPCRHRFHQDCVDSWLLHSHPTCPIDGLHVVVRNPSDQSAPRAHSSSIQTPSSVGEAATAHVPVDNLEGLMLTAMGIPVAVGRSPAPAGHHGGQARAGRLAGHASGSASEYSHMTGPGLELLGVGVSVGPAGVRDEVSTPPDSSDVTRRAVPGGRLLHQASQQRRRLAGRLLRSQQQAAASLSPDVDRLPALDMSTAVAPAPIAGSGADLLAPAALVNFLQSDAVLSGLDSGRDVDLGGGGERRPSLASRGSAQSENEPSASGRGHGARSRRVARATPSAVHHRPRSLDRSAGSFSNSPATRKELQEIFLGNPPDSQPAMTEEIGAASNRPPPAPKQRTRLFRSVFGASQSNPTIQTRGTSDDSGMRLQGNAFSTQDNL